MAQDFRSDVSSDVSAAAASSRELGPDYDAEVAAGLVERIGDEIDARIDARLAAHRPGPVWQPVYTSVALSGLGLAFGGVGSVFALFVGLPELMIPLWVLLAMCAMTYAVVRDLRR